MTNEGEWNDPSGTETAVGPATEPAERHGFGTEEITKEDADAGGFCEKAGWKHFQVVDVKDETEKDYQKFGAVRIQCLCLAGPDKGKLLFHYVTMRGKAGEALPDWAQRNALKFLYGTLAVREVVKDGKKMTVDAKTENPRINVETVMATKGKHFCAEIGLDKPKNPKYEPKMQLKTSKAYDPRDDAVAKVDKDWDALDRDGYKRGSSPEFTWEAEQAEDGDAPFAI